MLCVICLNMPTPLAREAPVLLDGASLCQEHQHAVLNRQAGVKNDIWLYTDERLAVAATIDALHRKAQEGESSVIEVLERRKLDLAKALWRENCGVRDAQWENISEDGRLYWLSRAAEHC